MLTNHHPCDRCKSDEPTRWVSKIGAWLCTFCRKVERDW